MHPHSAPNSPAAAPAQMQDANPADTTHIGHVAIDEAVAQVSAPEGQPLELSGGHGEDAGYAASSHFPVTAELSAPEAWQPLAGGIGLTSPLRRLLDTEDTQQQAMQAVEVLRCSCVFHSYLTSEQHASVRVLSPHIRIYSAAYSYTSISSTANHNVCARLEVNILYILQTVGW